MTDNKLTDEQVIKALECCSNTVSGGMCPICPIDEEDKTCVTVLTENALDLLKRKDAEIDILIRKNNTLKDEFAELKAQLEDSQDAHIRTVVDKDYEIEKLNVDLVGMRGACESYKIHYDNAQAEIERLRRERQLINEDLTNAFSKMRALRKDIKTAKAEARKEFVERSKEKAKYFYCKKDSGFFEECSFIETDIVDNLLKEMDGESE